MIMKTPPSLTIESSSSRINRESEPQNDIQLIKSTTDNTATMINLSTTTPITQKMISAGVGAILTSLMVTPFDVIKTRMQSMETLIKENESVISRFHSLSTSPIHQRESNTSNLFSSSSSSSADHHKHIHIDNKISNLPNNQQNQKIRINSTWQGLKHISTTESIPALWRGLIPTLIMAIPSTVIYYTSYESIRDQIHPLLNSVNLSLYAPLIAGSAARAGASFVTSPFELLRTRMQSGDVLQNSLWGATSSLSNTIKTEGINSVWRGLGSTLWRDIPFSALYWLVYEQMKKQIVVEDRVSDLGVAFFCGATSGTIAATATTPFDVAKTVQQVSKTGGSISMNTLLKNIYINEGLKGLFKGLSPRIAKVAPACAIMISSYEAGKMYFQQQF